MSTEPLPANDLRVVGDQISHSYGHYVLTLQWVREGVYSVVAYQGTLRRSEWCKSWGTVSAAFAWARMVRAQIAIERRDRWGEI
jgi:hypothetical protein